ncbi:MAG: hypothetical protein M1423_02615 [Acidobacteria bacterium]|nr:hypothetical protein [Acidobacteriota bacterium]
MAQFVIRVVGKNPEKFTISGLSAAFPNDSLTPTNNAMTEEELRAELESQGISERGIDQLIQHARASAH